MSSYKLVNISCGTPVDETQLTGGTSTSTTQISTAPFTGGTVTTSGLFYTNTGAIDTSTNAAIHAPEGSAVLGLALGSATTDYWNIVTSENNEYWVGLRDALGMRNASNILKARAYFNVDEAPKYFGVSGGVQVTSPPPATGASNISSIDNCALMGNYNNNPIIELDGLSPNPYLLIAYGERTQFDLNMNSGQALSKNSTNPAFYNYGYNTFDITRHQSFTVPVVPVVGYAVTGVQRVVSGGGTQLNWIVNNSDTSSNGFAGRVKGYVPLTWWQNKLAQSSVLTKQVFLDSTDSSLHTQVAANGIVFVPSSAADAYNGFLGNPGSFNIPEATGELGHFLQTEIKNINYYVNQTPSVTYVTQYAWTGVTNYSPVAGSAFIVDLTSPGTDPIPAGYPTSPGVSVLNPYTRISLLSYRCTTTTNPCLALIDLEGPAGGDILSYSYTPLNGTWTATQVPQYDYNNPSYSIGASRTTITTGNTTTFSGGWDVIAIAPDASYDGTIFETTDPVSNINFPISRFLYAPDISNATVPAQYTALSQTSNGSSYNPTSLNPTITGLQSMLLGDFDEAISGKSWGNAQGYDAYGLQLIQNTNYLANSNNLTGDLTSGTLINPLALLMPGQPEVPTGEYGTAATYNNRLYCLAAGQSLEFQVTADASDTVSVTWYRATGALTSSTSANGVSVITTTSGDFSITTSKTDVGGGIAQTNSILTVNNPEAMGYYYAKATSSLTSTNVISDLIGVNVYTILDTPSVTMAVTGGGIYTSGVASYYTGATATLTFTATVINDATGLYYNWYRNNNGTITYTGVGGLEAKTLIVNLGSTAYAPVTSGTTINEINSTDTNNVTYFVQVSTTFVPTCKNNVLGDTAQPNYCCDIVSSDQTALGVTVVATLSSAVSLTNVLGTTVAPAIGLYAGCQLAKFYVGGTGTAQDLTLTAIPSYDPADSAYITYQWNADGTAIGGATSSTYLITTATSTSHNYTCTVTDTHTGTSVTTPTITISSVMLDVPLDAVESGGDSHTLSAPVNSSNQFKLIPFSGATYTIPSGLNVQWFRSKNGGAYTHITAADSTTVSGTPSTWEYTTPTSGTDSLSGIAGDIYRYYAKVSAQAISSAGCDLVDTSGNPIVVTLT